MTTQAARYMTRFRCLGGDCEDTCCAGWTVPFDEPTHRRLKVLSAHEPSAQRLLDEGIQLTPEGPDFARLVFGADGYCRMLEDDGRCAIHARLGPDALADVCMMYPRYFNQVDEERELFGTISCPEVARQCLLHDDAFEPEPLELEQAPRKLRNRFATEEPYFRPFRALRSAMSELLARPGYALADKLFALLWFTRQLSSVVFDGCAALPEAELQGTLAALGQPQLLATLSANYRGLDVSGAFALSVLRQALPPSANANASASASPTAAADADAAAWASYGATRARVPETARARLDACLTRYAVNHLHTTPYMLSRTPFIFALELAVRVAALRYLLHQRLAGFQGDGDELDRQIVDVSYRFARHVEHAGSFEKLVSELESQRLDSLAHAVGFVSI